MSFHPFFFLPQWERVFWIGADLRSPGHKVPRFVTALSSSGEWLWKKPGGSLTMTTTTTSLPGARRSLIIWLLINLGSLPLTFDGKAMTLTGPRESSSKQIRFNVEKALTWTRYALHVWSLIVIRNGLSASLKGWKGLIKMNSYHHHIICSQWR